MNVASIFTGIASLAWLGFVGFIILMVVNASRNRPVRGGSTILFVIGIVAILFSVIGAGVVYVEPNERAVVKSLVSPNGYRAESLSSGVHFIIPFAESVVRYPISRQTYTMSVVPSEGQQENDDSITARTSDGQQIYVDASIIYAIDPTQVVKVHIEWQDRYQDGVVRPLARGVIRDVVSQYGVEEVVSSKRVEMTQRMSESMREKLSNNGLMMVDFILRNITFSEEYAASVEQKQIAEQQAQQAVFVVEQRKQEAEQARQVAKGQADAAVTRAEGEARARVIEAQAEAEALELVANVLEENPQLLTYQYITKLSPNIEVMLLPNDAPFLFPFPEIGPDTPASTTTTVPDTTQPSAPQPTPTTEANP